MATITPSEIQAIRANHGLSQSELANRLGLSHRTIQQWEHGLREPGERVTQRLIAMQSTEKQRRAKVLNAIKEAALYAEDDDRPEVATELRAIITRY